MNFDYFVEAAEKIKKLTKEHNIAVITASQIAGSHKKCVEADLYIKTREQLEEEGYSPGEIKSYAYSAKNCRIVETKCECGADKCNTTHSDWCPKHEK